MKVQSKALYEHLLKAGALNGSPEAVAMAKREYRKQYKKRWKRTSAPGKEIRIVFALKQFEAIRHHAGICELRVTAYARKAILATIDSNFRPLSEEMLSRSLQLISMAAISLSRHPAIPHVAMEMISEAETLLISLVKKQTNGA